MKIVVVLDQRGFDFKSSRVGKTFNIETMNLRAVNRLVHYGNDTGNRLALIDLNGDDTKREHSTWNAVFQAGCYGIFRPATPAPTTTTTTAATTTVSIAKKVRNSNMLGFFRFVLRKLSKPIFLTYF